MMGRTIGGVTDVVIGRKLRQKWSQSWQSPEANDPFGQFINPLRKHVVSQALSGDLGWNGTHVDADPAAYVRKRETGRRGIQTIRRLFLAGVVDALTPTLHPAVTPEGRRLFDESVPLTRLRMVDGAITSAGNAVLTYALRD